MKHFKFEQRGKRRLQKRPNAKRCKWWNDIERALVKPHLPASLTTCAIARRFYGPLETRLFSGTVRRCRSLSTHIHAILQVSFRAFDAASDLSCGARARHG